VVAETGAAATLGHMDVDISEAGEGWGDDEIIIDEGLHFSMLQSLPCHRQWWPSCG